ncbi:MAG: thermonuclease family protein [Parcubacteria group bacterium]|jgi:micrococcal nuclease
MAQKIDLLAILKAIIMVIFLPITLIWVVWQRTDWKKRNKWIATAAVVVVFVFLLSSGGHADKKPSETAALNSQVEELKNQLEAERHKNKEPEQTEQQPPQEETFKVARVVDGDTIKLESGQVVRYIGIDAPEAAGSANPAPCFEKEASTKNRQLVEGKEVRLVKDVSETDKYGRLLRYAYNGDTFVNDYLVRNGFAKSANYPPDTKFQDQLKLAEEEAKNNKRGLWAEGACQTETQSPSPAPPVSVAPTPAPIALPVQLTTPNTTGTYTCNCGKTCPQMGCAEAQYQLNTCGCTRRDADHDGIACDADCQ